MSEKSALTNTRGSALIACLLVTTLFMAAALWYSKWSRISTESRVHSMTAHTALTYADEGVTQAIAKLKSPGLNLFIPVSQTTSTVYSLLMPQGRVDTALSRPDPLDVNLFELNTTGYCYLPRGSFVDPLTEKRAQRATINTKVRVTNVGQFLFAVPTVLSVSYGTYAPDAYIYARNLEFDTCSVACGQATAIGTAYYRDSVANTPPGGVTPTFAKKLNYAVEFVSLDPNIRTFYEQMAQPLGPVLEGFVGEPSPSYVYFHSGDLHIAQTASLTVQGVYMVYATGNVYIDGNILLANPASPVADFVGILSEKDIILSKDAPNNLTLNAFFLCNGLFRAEPLTTGVRPSASVNLTINGGVVSLIGIEVAALWPGVRTYNYKTSTNPHFMLPNFSNTLEYKISGGKLQ